jgi:hypothetical protein
MVMTANDEQDKSPAMSDADVANGEGPGDEQAKPHADADADSARAAALDPDAPGTSALGLQDGDPVEPNEPG